MVMDIKILSAVLITLLAIGTGMGQVKGDLSLDSLSDLSSLTSSLKTIDINIGSLFKTQATANTTIEADIRFETENSTIEIPQQEQVEIQARGDETEIDIAGFKTTATHITMQGFTGSLTMNKNASASGTAQDVEIDQTEFTSSEAKDITINAHDPSEMAVTNSSGVDLQLEEATGTLSFPNQDIDVDESTVSVAQFSGTMERSWENGTISLSGKMATATVGTGTSQTTIGE